MIKDKKEKQSSSGGGSGAPNSKNNSSSGNSNATNSSPSSSKTTNSGSNSTKSGSSNNSSKNNILPNIKEEIIEQGTSEQLIVTSIKHEDGSPPTNIIKKEPANSASSASSSSSSSTGAGGGPSSNANASTVNSNDSNNNNDTNDNKNSNSSGNPLLPDDKDTNNDNSITDELLHNDELNSSGNGNNSSSNKMGMHIKSEDPATDPLAGVENSLSNSNYGPMNPNTPGSNRGGPMMSQNSPDRIQPLPSNVVNKQSNSMDYMQQQSQIFVFSTTLANKASEAVRSGRFQSIIAYHCEQPETKKFLQKFPLKVNQFNRTGPHWFNNMPPNMKNNKNSRMMPMNQQNFNFMKNNPMNPQQQQQQQPGGGPMNNQIGMHPSGGFPSSCDMNNDSMIWGGPGNQNQMNMDPLGNGPHDPLLNDSIEGLVSDPLGPSPTNQMPNLQSPMGGSGNSCMDPTSPSVPLIQGVKIPDEDLTPQQRQQRAMKLAHLQELQKMLKQENSHMNPNDCQMNDDPTVVMQGGGPMNQGPCSKMGPMGPNQMNPMMQGPPMMGNPHPHGPMNGPMRPNFPMGMPPRGNMCRPMGPMGMNPNSMNDEMSGMGPGMIPMPCSGPMNSMNSGNMMSNMGMPHMQQGGNNMGMNNMGPGGCNMGPGPNMGMMAQKGMPPNMMGGPNMQAHMEWNKLQQQYYDESKRKGPGGPVMANMDMSPNDPSMGMNPMGRQMPPGMRNPNMRGPGVQQGPPPPYHQTPRSASVPIATQSPNPNSPNNPTSNLSLPSPRGSCNSTLNSPAAGDPSRSMNPQQAFKHMNPRQSPTTSQDSPAGGLGRQINHSNPSTPISSHLSPSASLKDLDMSTNPNKEPNLMPVPSPQQISYLNSFEGQELTIQKQPNTNVKDGTSNIGGPNQANLNLDNRLAGQKTPTSSANPHMNNFPIPSSPHTPGGSSISGDKNRINSAGPSPQNNLQRSNSMMGNNDPSSYAAHQQQSNESNMQFPTDTPNMPFGPNAHQQQQNKMGNFMDQKAPNEMGNNNGPPQFPPCSGRPENLPLNPNSNTSMPNTKPSHFDPISSLAQMSQQLTSTGVPGPMNGQPMMGGFNNNGMMNDMGPMMGPDGMGPGGQMDFGPMGPGPGNPNQYSPMGGPRSMSPKIGPPMGFPGGPGGMNNMRMVGRPMGFNGTNIQVKPNAPNTIQYLPARPQMNNSNPRGPPSLDFLQRFTNPMGMDEMNKGGNQAMPYFPNQNNPGNMGPCMGAGMDPDGSGVNQMGPGPGNVPPGMMNQGPMNPMMRGMRGSSHAGGNMMRFPGPPSQQNPCMMGNNSFNSSNNANMPGDQMFGGAGPNQQNPQMFVAGPKGSPMSGPNPEQMQQMMGGPGPHFKQQQQQQQQQPHFPSNADPNYAQQYQNFQQQLYSINNSNNRNQMGMGGGNQAFMPK